MKRIIYVALILTCAITVQASQLVILHSMEDNPPSEDWGSITNTTASSFSDSGSLGDESYSTEVSYGEAKTSANSSSSAGSYDSDVGHSTATATWDDTLTFGNVGTNLFGNVSFTFAFSGLVSASASQGAESGANYGIEMHFSAIDYFRNGGQSAGDGASSYGGDAIDDFTVNTDYLIDLNQSHDFYFFFGTYIGASAGALSSASASATNMHLTLTGITVTDSEGNPIAASLSSDSGTNYPIQAVPEPASAALLVLSGIGFYIFRRILIS